MDDAGFQLAFAEHHGVVFRFAFALTQDRDAAEEIAQECFLDLWRRRQFDASRGSLRGYLLGAARNQVFKRLRRSGREEPLDDLYPAAAPSSGNGELTAAVDRAIADLPLLQREALTLFEFEQLSLEEIATLTGIETGAVKSRLARARDNLRRRLAPYRDYLTARGVHGTT
jgi:RNA polymerase sigma-70 factor (ECF subfamily)